MKGPAALYDVSHNQPTPLQWQTCLNYGQRYVRCYVLCFGARGVPLDNYCYLDRALHTACQYKLQIIQQLTNSNLDGSAAGRISTLGALRPRLYQEYVWPLP